MATDPQQGGSSRIPIHAMTAREQVCIALRVPGSGTEWLDEIIAESIRIEFGKIQWEGLCRLHAFMDRDGLEFPEDSKQYLHEIDNAADYANQIMFGKEEDAENPE